MPDERGAPFADAAATIAAGDVPEWIAQVDRMGRLIAPGQTPAGDVVYGPVGDPRDVLWDFTNSLAPPKQFLLPQTDPLALIRRGADGIHVEPVEEGGRLILFNVRSCDVHGLRRLADVYDRDLPDDMVRRRMARTVLVSLACTRPCPDGFCVCCDAGPFLTEGFDLQLVPLGGRVLAQIGSDAGRELVEAAGGLFRPAALGDLARAHELDLAARRGCGDETCHFGSAMRRLSTGRVAPALWRSMADYCLGCGACTQVCPTCYCFSVHDRAEDDGWTRYRYWDSCQYAAFALEASGHNPRRDRADRIKRRFYHKVSAQCFQREGGVGCVGCGRCVAVCMGGPDMPAAVAAMRTGAWHG